MSLVLGIDGGGTNTRAVIERDGVVLSRGGGGSIKRLRVGAEAAEANLRGLLRECFEGAGVDTVEAASAGVASASLPGVAEWITAVFGEFGIGRSEVVGDEVIALDAAFRGGAGECWRVLVDAGGSGVGVLDWASCGAAGAYCIRSGRADGDAAGGG